jgi:CheY-like chemotaxis protein
VADTVLVVDDDAGIQLTVQSILEDEGYDVVVAGDGMDALSKLDRHLPSLILLDITMPRMDGYAFAEELVRLGIRTRYPILVLTADGRAEQKAARVGAVGYLQKPFTVPGLLDAVAEILG